MVKVVKKEGESAGALLFRFSKKVKQSGILKEAKKRRFRDRPVNRRKKRVSALHREKVKKEIEKLRKLGLANSMASLVDKINQDIKVALKAGEALKVGALRFILAQVHNQEISNRGKGEVKVLTDAQVGEVIKQEVKKRREAISMFKQSNRGDLVEKEEAELAIISDYLPPMMGQDEIQKLVEEVVTSLQVNDFASVMKEVMARVKGQAEGSEVSRIVKERLSK